MVATVSGRASSCHCCLPSREPLRSKAGHCRDESRHLLLGKGGCDLETGGGCLQGEPRPWTKAPLRIGVAETPSCCGSSAVRLWMHGSCPPPECVPILPQLCEVDVESGVCLVRWGNACESRTHADPPLSQHPGTRSPVASFPGR